jgi:hypothetical protein
MVFLFFLSSFFHFCWEGGGGCQIEMTAAFRVWLKESHEIKVIININSRLTTSLNIKDYLQVWFVSVE